MKDKNERINKPFRESLIELQNKESYLVMQLMKLGVCNKCIQKLLPVVDIQEYNKTTEKCPPPTL
jgi:hypothetical protein